MNQTTLKLRNALIQCFKSLLALLRGLLADSQQDFLNRLTSHLAQFRQTFLYNAPSPLWRFMRRNRRGRSSLRVIVNLLAIFAPFEF